MTKTRETMIAELGRRHPAAADDVDAILAMPRSDAVSEDATRFDRLNRKYLDASRLADDRRKEIAVLRTALERAQRLFKEALPKFDWGKSALDGNAIQLLNEVPGEVARALSRKAKP